MPEAALITNSDVATYRKIDSNYESNRFAGFVMEAQRRQLRDLLGADLYYALMADGRTSGIYYDLLTGKVYTYNGNSIQYYGLKPFLVYTWLAIAAREGDFFHANHGNVRFVNNPQQNMEKISNAERQMLINEYQENANSYAQDIVQFLDEHSTTYTLWTSSKNVKLTGFQSFII